MAANDEERMKDMALGDAEVRKFMEKFSKCSVRGNWLSKEMVRDLKAEYPQTYSRLPDGQVFHILIDTLQEGMVGIPERPMLHVYIDPEKGKIVLKKRYP